ncbi:unnamed protein product, partial [Didymodactylos carnosus]
ITLVGIKLPELIHFMAELQSLKLLSSLTINTDEIQDKDDLRAICKSALQIPSLIKCDVSCGLCDTMTRDKKFEKLLEAFQLSASASDYFNEICSTYYQILELGDFIAPLNFIPLMYFDSSEHMVDRVAQTYLRKCSNIIVQGLIPIETHSDGNCLYYSILRLMSQCEITHIELRVRTIIELIKNYKQYETKYGNSFGIIQEHIRYMYRNYAFSEMYEIIALCDVLQCNIESVYPNIDYSDHLNKCNYTYSPIKKTSFTNKTITILWTHALHEVEARRNSKGTWTANHFVPLVLPCISAQSQIMITSTFQSNSAVKVSTIDL